MNVDKRERQNGRRYSVIRLGILLVLALMGVAWVVVPSFLEWRFSRAWERGEAEYLNAIYGFPRSVRFVKRERAPSGVGYLSLHDGTLAFAQDAAGRLSVAFSGEDGVALQMPAPNGWARAYPLSGYALGRRTLTIPDAYWYVLPEHEVEIVGREIRIHWKSNRNQRPM